MKVIFAYLGVVLIWSTTPLAIKWSVDGVHFVDAVFGRMGLAAILSWSFMKLMRSNLTWSGGALRSYIAASLGIWGCMLLVYWSAQTLASGVMSVLFGLSPLITGLIASVVLKERAFTPRRLISLGLAFCGLLVVFYSELGVQEGQLTALLINMAAVTLFCISAVWVKKVDASVDPQQQTTGSLLISIPVFIVFWWFLSSTEPHPAPSRALWAIGYLALFGSVIGFVLYFYILRNLGASQVSLIPMMTPCLALFLGNVLNDEQLPVTTLLGAGMIIMALVVYFSEGVRSKASNTLAKFRKRALQRR